MVKISKRNSSLGIIILAFLAFISLGLPDGLLGVAWPSMANFFERDLDAMGVLLIAGTAGYMLSSFFSGMLLRKLGVGGLLALSCGLTSAALLSYTLIPFWWLIPAAAVVLGLGAGAIDAGLNNYVARHHSERTMHWLHASFGIGITLGPLIMTWGLAITDRWQSGYRIVAFGQVLLALLFLFTRSSWMGEGDVKQSSASHLQASMGDSLRRLPVLLSILMFFLYTGLELGLGLWTFSLLTESRQVQAELAGYITGLYWATFTLGRILAGGISRKISGPVLLRSALLLAGVGILLILLNRGVVLTAGGIALTGFALAPVFPGLVFDTERRVGKSHQANTIGMQISAAGLGIALIPSLAGILADRFGLEIIPWYMLADLVLLFLLFLFAHLQKEELE